MRRNKRLSKSFLFSGTPIRILTPLLLLMTALPSFGAELSIQYELIARSGVTPIPGGVGTHTGFSEAPAVDSDGNVVFVATGGLDGNGNTQSGIYTFINGQEQKAADKNTLVPGGGGAKFSGFYGSDLNDIDGGRIAFRATTSPSGRTGVYSNAGQFSPNDLVELAVIDGADWISGGHPWVDGDVVALHGRRLVPQDHRTILRWDGSHLTEDFIDPGTNYRFALNTNASISGEATIFRRLKTGVSELVIESGGVYETLVELGVTPMPGQGGSVFGYLDNYPLIDRGGLDAAFLSGGVYKRANGGALEEVATNTTTVPGAGSAVFTSFPEAKLSLANGQVVFYGLGLGLVSFDGIYTDIGGDLSVIVDDQDNNTIEIDGNQEQVTAFRLGNKGFSYTPDGYMVVFKAWLQSGGIAIIRATINAPESASKDTLFKGGFEG